MSRFDALVLQWEKNASIPLKEKKQIISTAVKQNEDILRLKTINVKPEVINEMRQRNEKLSSEVDPETEFTLGPSIDPEVNPYNFNGSMSTKTNGEVAAALAEVAEAAEIRRGEERGAVEREESQGREGVTGDEKQSWESLAEEQRAEHAQCVDELQKRKLREEEEAAEIKRKEEELRIKQEALKYKGMVILMRHSVRLDQEKELADITPEEWAEKTDRPADPPICDRELPRVTAKDLEKFYITCIVSSPYRRCLETAGIVARELGVKTVHVDDRLGEWYKRVKPAYMKVGKSPVGYEAVSREVAQGYLGKGVELGEWRKHPVGEEDCEGLQDRVSTAVPEIQRRHKNDTLLLVTHGDIANRFLPESQLIGDGYGDISLDECGWVALRPPPSGFISGRSSQEDIVQQGRTAIIGA